MFVGALHGMMKPEDVAHIFDEVFGPVRRVHFETDADQYPKGSGSVVFSDRESFKKAVAARHVIVYFQQAPSALNRATAVAVRYTRYSGLLIT